MDNGKIDLRYRKKGEMTKWRTFRCWASTYSALQIIAEQRNTSLVQMIDDFAHQEAAKLGIEIETDPLESSAKVLA